MCNAEQTLAVVQTFSLNTFKLQVQPFGVTTNQFATGTFILYVVICFIQSVFMFCPLTSVCDDDDVCM